MADLLLEKNPDYPLKDHDIVNQEVSGLISVKEFKEKVKLEIEGVSVDQF